MQLSINLMGLITDTHIVLHGGRSTHNWWHMLWKQEENRKTNPEQTWQKCLQSTKHIHSPTFWLHYQILEFNLRRHIKSGKSPSNNNKQQQHIQGCVLLLHSDVTEMLCYWYDCWHALMWCCFRLPNFHLSSLVLSLLWNSSIFHHVSKQQGAMKLSGPGTPIAQTSVIWSFESWGWDVTWFLRVRVTLLFAALSKAGKTAEARKEFWASCWKCGEREEVKLAQPCVYQSSECFTVYTVAEKEVGDLIRQSRSDLRHCHPEKKNNNNKTSRASHAQHVDEWHNNDWKQFSRPPQFAV